MSSLLDELPPEPLEREVTVSAEVFDDVVARVTPALVRLARSYRIPEHEIEDLVQTVWLVAWRKRAGIANLSAWARVTTRNRCLMYWRSKRVEERMTDGEGEEPERTEELRTPSSRRCERGIDLGRVLQELPRERRRAAMLYVTQGLNA